MSDDDPGMVAARQAVAEAVERYGLNVEGMGPKFRQALLDERAAQLKADFEALRDQGVEVERLRAAYALNILERLVDEVGAEGPTSADNSGGAYCILCLESQESVGDQEFHDAACLWREVLRIGAKTEKVLDTTKPIV
jgi:hypothetical protein